MVISAGHALHDTYTAFLPPLLPLLIQRFALARAEAGLLSVFLSAPSLIQPLIGHLADRLSLRYLVILSPAISAILMSLLGLAPSYAVIAMLLIVAGLSSASLHAVGPVMAGRLSGGNLGRGMGFWMLGGELGRTLGPIVIVTGVRFFGLEGSAYLMAGGVAASFLLYLRLRDVPGRPTTEAARLPWRDALGGMGRFFIPLSGIMIARAFLLTAITTYLPTFLSEKGETLFLAGGALTLVEGAGVVGALLGGSASDRWGRRLILGISLLTTPLLLLAFLGAHGWTRLPLLLVLGFAGISVTPVVMALVQENFPRNRALANGVYMAISFGIRSVVIVLVGALGDRYGLHRAFGAGALISLLGLPLLLLLPIRKGDRT